MNDLPAKIEWYSISFVGNGHRGDTSLRAISVDDAIARFKLRFPEFRTADLIVKENPLPEKYRQ